MISIAWVDPENGKIIKHEASPELRTSAEISAMA